MDILEQKLELVPVDIARNRMSEIYIGVAAGHPFISEVDEIYVFYKGLWYMAEWTQFECGDAHQATAQIVNELNGRVTNLKTA